MDKIPAISFNRRIVLEHTAGPHAGLFQIMGHADVVLQGRPAPREEVCDIRPHARTSCVELAKITPRYILYREVTK